MFSIFNVTKLIVIIYDGDLWCELNYLFMTLFDKKTLKFQAYNIFRREFSSQVSKKLR